MNMMNPKVDWFFKKGPWQEEFEKLKTIVLDCGLTEELKWGCPCYTFEKNNIVLIHGFKEYCALLFFKGALLNDADAHLAPEHTPDLLQTNLTQRDTANDRRHGLRSGVAARTDQKRNEKRQRHHSRQFAFACNLKRSVPRVRLASPLTVVAENPSFRPVTA